MAPLVESLRAIGYSLETAVADIIDNSLAAQATRIELFADTHSDEPSLGILDNGHGMSEDQLHEAMRLGSKSPIEERAADDLGRFGLGLKTASFSQCRRVTVVTRKGKMTSRAVWDLDRITEVDDWRIELPDDDTDIPWAEKLSGDGTLVIWQKLDGFSDNGQSIDHEKFVRQLRETASHLELVFHRYLSGEARHSPVEILLNERLLEPKDPFFSHHPATQRGPKETFQYRHRKVHIETFTLPHRDKVSASEWEEIAGKEGHLKNQGFYVYRNRRLIARGTWFNLARQVELTKLARVRIDIPNSLDREWKIDIRKASVQLPEVVRKRLLKLIGTIGKPSVKAHTQRGARTAGQSDLSIWRRVQNKNVISYVLAQDHPVFAEFEKKLDYMSVKKFHGLMNLIDSSFPMDTLFIDINNNASKCLVAPDLDFGEFANYVRSVYCTLKRNGASCEEAESKMFAERFMNSRKKEVKEIIAKLEKEN